MFEVDFPYDNMTLLVKRAARDGRLRAHFEPLAMEDIPDGTRVSWTDGKVRHLGRGCGYYHRVTEKRLGKQMLPRWREAPSSFFVTPYGFYKGDPDNSKLLTVLDRSRQATWRARRAVRRLLR